MRAHGGTPAPQCSRYADRRRPVGTHAKGTTTTEHTTTTTAPVAPADPLARVSLELLAEYRTAAEARDAADRALAEHLSPTAQALGRTLSDAVTDMHGATTDFQVAEVCRHAPGLAPAIRILWAHVLDCRLDRVGACCIDGGMIDP